MRNLKKLKRALEALSRRPYLRRYLRIFLGV